MRILEVEYVFTDDGVDPIYKQIGLNMEADGVEIIEDGVIDLDTIIGASKFYESTQVYTNGGHVFILNIDFNEFKKVWII